MNERKAESREERKKKERKKESGFVSIVILLLFFSFFPSKRVSHFLESLVVEMSIDNVQGVEFVIFPSKVGF